MSNAVLFALLLSACQSPLPPQATLSPWDMLLQRHGGSAQHEAALLGALRPVRDRLLASGRLPLVDVRLGVAADPQAFLVAGRWQDQQRLLLSQGLLLRLDDPALLAAALADGLVQLHLGSNDARWQAALRDAHLPAAAPALYQPSTDALARELLVASGVSPLALDAYLRRRLQAARDEQQPWSQRRALRQRLDPLAPPWPASGPLPPALAALQAQAPRFRRLARLAVAPPAVQHHALPLLADAWPELPAVHGLAGKMWLREGEPERAEAAYSQALALQTGYYGHYFGRGLARHQLGQLTAAQADFSRALALYPPLRARLRLQR